MVKRCVALVDSAGRADSAVEAVAAEARDDVASAARRREEVSEACAALSSRHRAFLAADEDNEAMLRRAMAEFEDRRRRLEAELAEVAARTAQLGELKRRAEVERAAQVAAHEASLAPLVEELEELEGRLRGGEALVRAASAGREALSRAREDAVAGEGRARKDRAQRELSAATGAALAAAERVVSSRVEAAANLSKVAHFCSAKVTDLDSNALASRRMGLEEVAVELDRGASAARGSLIRVIRAAIALAAEANEVHGAVAEVVVQDIEAGCVDVEAEHGKRIEAIGRALEQLRVGYEGVGKAADLPSKERTPFGSPVEVDGVINSLREKLLEKISEGPQPRRRDSLQAPMAGWKIDFPAGLSTPARHPEGAIDGEGDGDENFSRNGELRSLFQLQDPSFES